jgi:hypothetical protein
MRILLAVVAIASLCAFPVKAQITFVDGFEGGHIAVGGWVG